MSELRKKLQSAKKSHQAARYAGDLASDVLMPRISIGRQLLIGASVAGAIAAVLLIIVWLGRTSGTTSNQVAIVAPSKSIQQQNTQQESVLLPFTIDRPADAQLTASVSETSPTTSPSSTDNSMSMSMPAVWGFPTVSSIQEELSSQTQTQSDEESSS